MKRREKTRAEDFMDDDDGEAERTFVASPLSSPARTTEKTERLNLVRQAVGALPSDLRQVVVMKEFEEMTFLEISETLDLPLSTVKSRLYTALKQLRMRLERTPVEVV
jgi:RNA polymerase sigma-70 factor (ECF subfamily)